MKRTLPPLLTLLLLRAAAAPLHADFQNGQYADLALGNNLRMEQTILNPRGIAVDPLTSKVFVSDETSHRILRFSSAGAMQNGAAAEAVLGQPDLESTDWDTTASRLNAPAGLDVDSGGRLWVADTGNHRVLRFDNASALPSGAPASGVLGQPNFTSRTPGTLENLMISPAAVAADKAGRLWVADSVNQRVLRFDQAAARPPGSNANAVLGQINFTANTTGTSANKFIRPSGIAVEEAGIGGSLRLWVADTYNHRVLRFDNAAAKANGAAADAALGVPNWTTPGDTVTISRSTFDTPSALAVESGRLWVTDSGNNRVLRFDAAASKSWLADASAVFGQVTFTTGFPAFTPGRLDQPAGLAVERGTLWICDRNSHRVVCHDDAATKGYGTDADSVIGQTAVTDNDEVNARNLSPVIRGLAIDPVSGKLFVCDAGNNRVLRFPSVDTLISGSLPEAVLGQSDFFSRNAGAGATRMTKPFAAAMDHHGHLWVADLTNNRVLRFDNAANLPSGSGAAHVIGQPDFVSNSLSNTTSGLYQPAGLALYETFDRLTSTWTTRALWVGDMRNYRIMRFNAPESLGIFPAASGWFGSLSSGTTASKFMSPGGMAADSGGTLWVSDEVNSRVLRFDDAFTKPNGAPADGVLLQPDFVTAHSLATRTSGAAPGGLCLGKSGRLFVPDWLGNRVVIFDKPAAKPNGAPADLVLGQPHFTSTASSPAWNRLTQCAACVTDAKGRLWATDDTNRRVIRFTPVIGAEIQASGLNAQGKFHIKFTSTAGDTYEVRSSTDLLDWATVESTVAATGELMEWVAPLPATGRRYYRLQLKL